MIGIAKLKQSIITQTKIEHLVPNCKAAKTLLLKFGPDLELEKEARHRFLTTLKVNLFAKDDSYRDVIGKVSYQEKPLVKLFNFCRIQLIEIWILRMIHCKIFHY